MHKHILILAAALLLTAAGAQAQTFDEWGTSDTTPAWDCGQYQWPEVLAPCPEVQIKQKHDHTPQQKYLERGWDTAVTCTQRELILSCMPYLPVQFFNGQYTVDEIPYDPADTTFHFGAQLPNDDDDYFCALQPLPQSSANGAHPFPFYFFGKKKTSFVAAGNGIIAFNPAAANQFCSFNVKPPIPWSSDQNDQTHYYSIDSFYRDAIYGVYQDTDPSGDMSGFQGIWYGIKDDYPCRKIIASYNELPWYPHGSNTSNRQSYQIICYEGSNIIEIHVKRRRRSEYNCGWCNWGLIGIQNADGKPQQPGAPDSPSRFVHAGAHAAYFPVGTNTMTNAEQIDMTAYRFTPQGLTETENYWIRIFDNGDTARLTNDPEDPNGYFIKMQKDLPAYERDFPSCETLTLAYIKPKQTSKYCFVLRFQNADGMWYNLRDTIVVGVDNDNFTSLHPVDTTADIHSKNICAGQTADLTLDFPLLNDTTGTSWHLTRISDGQEIQLPLNLLQIGQIQADDSLKHISVKLNSANLPAEGTRENKIDSIYIQVSMSYNNGCDSNSNCLVCIYPNFDTVVEVVRCQGESFYWDLTGETYRTDTQLRVDTVSMPKCDSIVHLDLKFLTVRHIVKHVSDCKPYTWTDGNGQTYYQSNASTSANDTVRVLNEFGCEDIIQLDFTLYPLTPRIHTNIDHFTYDQTTVELTDVSEGGNSSLWKMPDGSEQTGTQAFYTAPLDIEEAKIILVAGSPYGCSADTSVVIPFNKETLYMPNIFTPGNTAGNNHFGPVSEHTLTQEMYIYNRRGELVFQCDEVNCQWDGRDSKGNLCEQGTYVYFVRYTNIFEPDRTRVKKGTATLVKEKNKKPR